MADKRRSSVSKSIGGTNQRGHITPAPITRIKILSVGSSQSGKSCLIKRYCEERFISKYIATIGVDYGVKPVQIDGNTVRVNFWDLSGLSEFFEIRNEFYKDTQGVLLVYDVSSRESFDELDSWIAEATKFGANLREIPTVMCGNKVDKRRVVGEDEARSYATSKGFHYVESSAASGMNVQEIFDHMFQTQEALLPIKKYENSCSVAFFSVSHDIAIIPCIKQTQKVLSKVIWTFVAANLRFKILAENSFFYVMVISLRLGLFEIKI
eukprot:gene7746-15843_t